MKILGYLIFNPLGIIFGPLFAVAYKGENMLIPLGLVMWCFGSILWIAIVTTND